VRRREERGRKATRVQRLVAARGALDKGLLRQPPTSSLLLQQDKDRQRRQREQNLSSVVEVDKGKMTAFDLSSVADDAERSTAAITESDGASA
jgi:hypothetical protein